ncbi:hypothetical protein B0H16DRAFT_42734 [Mycena metata]|uniref:Uncharacterized protein n=1 Tax=Mycena metata TaxID=1033252 RepID=A0AAD7NUC5_9AGAR|nr:hypothetical protein B0H16DRAFT_42734 [Mycena metata]
MTLVDAGGLASALGLRLSAQWARKHKRKRKRTWECIGGRRAGKRYRPAPEKGYGECRMVFSRSEAPQVTELVSFSWITAHLFWIGWFHSRVLFCNTAQHLHAQDPRQNCARTTANPVSKCLPHPCHCIPWSVLVSGEPINGLNHSSPLLCHA